MTNNPLKAQSYSTFDPVQGLEHFSFNEKPINQEINQTISPVPCTDLSTLYFSTDTLNPAKVELKNDITEEVNATPSLQQKFLESGKLAVKSFLGSFNDSVSCA